MLHRRKRGGKRCLDRWCRRPGFLPVAAVVAARCAILASCSACSRAWRSFARASILPACPCDSALWRRALAWILVPSSATAVAGAATPPPSHAGCRPSTPNPAAQPQTGPSAAQATTRPPTAAAKTRCRGRSGGSCSCTKGPGREAGKSACAFYRTPPRLVKSDKLPAACRSGGVCGIIFQGWPQLPPFLPYGTAAAKVESILFYLCS